MPRPTLPPTPTGSTDMKSQESSNTSQIPLQLAFELPPPALPNTSTYIQPAEAVKSRRRTATTASSSTPKEPFALPPPPTRTRKIIQMKPRGQAEEGEEEEEGEQKKEKGKKVGSAAGRKQARKTAHSLIERRRRSKMNEEFAQLKSMIPACTGEMHKLAILQASIEYVRYLEDCITQLKTQQSTTTPPFTLPPQTNSCPTSPDVDHPMSTSATPSPALHPLPNTVSATPSPALHPLPGRISASASPALHPHDSRHRHDSYSSVSAEYPRYGYSSATASPAFGPQFGYPTGSVPTGITLASPALAPQRDLDQEATTALLMLNSDRRGFEKSEDGSEKGRGMSVRDLLSS